MPFYQSPVYGIRVLANTARSSYGVSESTLSCFKDPASMGWAAVGEALSFGIHPYCDNLRKNKAP